MAQFNINITQGSAPYTISIKAFGDNTERWISGGVSGSGTVVFNGLTGNNNYNVSVSSNGCTTGNDTFSMNCVVPTVPNSCSLSIADVIVFCNSYNNGTVTVNVNNPDNYILEYQIDNYITWQTGNVFNNITNTGTGYTIRVRNKNNIQCEVHQNTVYVDCITPNPTPVTPTVPTPVPNSPTPSSPVPSVPSPSPVNNCNLSISNISVSCNAFNDAQVTVIANNPNGYNLEYQIDNYILWQSGNVFNNIANTGTGYTIRVRNRDNVQCEAVQNTVYVDCISQSPTPVVPNVPNSPVPSTPSPINVPTNNCNLSITGVNVICVGDNNGTVVVSVNNPNNYSLQYQIDNYISWQQSDTFNNITNTGTGYTVRVRDANNPSCESVYNGVYVDCHSVPTPVTPTPTPISPTPVGCNGITNLSIYGSNVVTPNSQNSYTSSYSGDAPYSYLWNISGQGTSVIGANNGDIATFQFGSSNGTITLTVTNCGGTYSVDFPFSQQGSPTPTPVPTPISTVPSLGVSFADVLYSNDGTDSYDFRLYQSTPGIVGSGSYVEIANNRHLPTSASSATNSYLIAGYSSSIAQGGNTRFYRFAMNLTLLKSDFPSVNTFTFDMYGARKSASQTGVYTVRTSLKRQNIIDTAPNNGVDFGVANAESVYTDNTGKVCASVDSYVQIGYFTYSVTNDTFIFTDLTNSACIPI